MNKLLTILKEYALPLSMILGVLAYRWFVYLTPILSTLIFIMLFFTFCKINPLDLRLHKWHFVLLFIQILLTIISFYALKNVSPILAQGVMLCFIMPTAAAAPIIAGKLGGSIQSLTSFTILSNISTAILVPTLFPIFNPAADMSFWQASSRILIKVGPLLICPFLLAWLVRILYDAWQKHLHSNKTFHLSAAWADIPYYVWAFSLVVLMAQITQNLLTENYNIWIVVILTVAALITCLTQFFIGKVVGRHLPSAPHGDDYKDVLINDTIATDDIRQITSISAGQALGQKNTTLGIWMANTYLNPLAGVGAAAYIIWQNLFNAYQLARAAHGKRV